MPTDKINDIDGCMKIDLSQIEIAKLHVAQMKQKYDIDPTELNAKQHKRAIENLEACIFHYNHNKKD